jgi:hypothetical protein
MASNTIGTVRLILDVDVQYDGEDTPPSPAKVGKALAKVLSDHFDSDVESMVSDELRDERRLEEGVEFVAPGTTGTQAKFRVASAKARKKAPKKAPKKGAKKATKRAKKPKVYPAPKGAVKPLISGYRSITLDSVGGKFTLTKDFEGHSGWRYKDKYGSGQAWVIAPSAGEETWTVSSILEDTPEGLSGGETLERLEVSEAERLGLVVPKRLKQAKPAPPPKKKGLMARIFG